MRITFGYLLLSGLLVVGCADKATNPQESVLKRVEKGFGDGKDKDVPTATVNEKIDSVAEVGMMESAKEVGAKEDGDGIAKNVSGVKSTVGATNTTGPSIPKKRKRPL